jgi:hypothetical protein
VHEKHDDTGGFHTYDGGLFAENLGMKRVGVCDVLVDASKAVPVDGIGRVYPMLIQLPRRHVGVGATFDGFSCWCDDSPLMRVGPVEWAWVAANALAGRVADVIASAEFRVRWLVWGVDGSDRATWFASDKMDFSSADTIADRLLDGGFDGVPVSTVVISLRCKGDDVWHELKRTGCKMRLSLGDGGGV